MRVAVLMGGRSGEYDVSLRSGAAVLAALDGHDTLAITLLRDGGARVGDDEGPLSMAFAALETWRPDVAFIAMHGPDGEDGRIQGALELLRIPYQGSRVQASAIGLDKVRTKAVFRSHGLPIAAERVATPAACEWHTFAAELGLPLVLKTPASGSSVGVEIVSSEAALRERGQALLAEVGCVLVEQFVRGREFTLPVVERADGTPEAFPVVEIRVRSDAPASGDKASTFFDYVAKYTPGATDEICPAPIAPELERELRQLGVAAHIALGCRGYSRTDCIVADDGRVVLLELNTLPGLTRESLLPKSAAAHGVAFPALVERLLARATFP